MNRHEFENKNGSDWKAFELQLESSKNKKESLDSHKLPSRFRKICYDLSLAQYRMFGQKICDRLNGLAIVGHRQIHRERGAFGEGFLRFFLRTFPAAFRQEWKLFVVVSFVFFGPFFAMWFSADKEIEWIQALLGAEAMSDIEGMYGKEADSVEYLRQKHGSNFMMFAHYVNNNVGIDFRIFAGGIFFGIGTLFFLIYNGLYLGAVVGYVEYAGDSELLWKFVAGHSSFELLGMLVVGMAGLKIGFALLAPGQFTRGEALTRAGRGGLPLLIGGACMTALAAVVEGFWSARPIDTNLKYMVGSAFWVLHLLYFGFVGRGRAWNLRK
jgi:uncharacterized membrane protein SpoIIM required for sporulation